MSLAIYKAYTAQKKKEQERKIQKQLSGEDKHIEEHKAKITMEFILAFIHEWKDDDEEVAIEKKSFLHFTLRVQRKMGNEEV